MDTYLSRKRRKVLPEDEANNSRFSAENNEELTTDEKLAILSSVFEQTAHEELLEALLIHNGCVEEALDSLLDRPSLGKHSRSPQKRTPASNGIQSSLQFVRQIRPEHTKQNQTTSTTTPRSLTKKGKTLYLYSPSAIAQHTPCTIIHNFLPPSLANALLQELLPETESFTSATFRLFDNVVKSPHTASFYVDSLTEGERERGKEYCVKQLPPVYRASRSKTTEHQ